MVRTYADYADEIYKSACNMQTLGFILPPSRRFKFYILALFVLPSQPVFTLEQSNAELNLKDKFHSRRFEILKFQSRLNLTEVGRAKF